MIEAIESARPDVVIREVCKETKVVEDFREVINPAIFLIGIGDPAHLHENIEDYAYILDGFLSLKSSLEHIQQELEEVQRRKFSPGRLRAGVSTMLREQT